MNDELIRILNQVRGYDDPGMSVTEAHTAISRLISEEVDAELELLQDPDILKIIRNQGVKHWVQLRRAELDSQRRRGAGA